ncbi:MAG TPA: hypothetical protein VNP96_07110 [Solirubrobacterales bacterium]|nr:hypothetical protein [Solirubrobacterales bacterium]
MAVGDYEIIGKGEFTMAQKWDGTNWTAEKPPSPGTSSNFLSSISCVASNWCDAAGSYLDEESHLVPLIEHFSG